MMHATLAAARGELTKIRSARWSIVALVLFVVVSVGVGGLEGWSVQGAIVSHSPALRPDFTPAQAGFDGILYGQLVLIVFGVLLVTNEYGSRMIGLSLLAVPRRGQFFAAKMAVAALVAAAVAVPTVVAAYLATELTLGPYGVSVFTLGVPRAMLGAVAYSTLICLFAAGLAMIARSPILPLATLIPLVLAGSQILSVIGATAAVARFLPDRAGMRILAVVPGGAGELTPLVGLLVLLTWVTAALVSGFLLLRHRDA
jgi:ABC-2 type transport system permease protein